MKLINQYEFKNNKKFGTYFITNRDRKKYKTVPEVDNLMLMFGYDGGKVDDSTKIFIRPDEALMIAKMLVDAVWKITGDFQERQLRGYYGYSETHLPGKQPD